MTTTEHIREHLLECLGVFAQEAKRLPDLAELEVLQRAPEFERLCSNRMVMGAFRYGLMRKQKQSGNGYDNVGSLIHRARLYQQSGNLEHLCDVANLAMVEFVTSQHPKRHFRADDDGVHAQRED